MLPMTACSEQVSVEGHLCCLYKLFYLRLLDLETLLLCYLLVLDGKYNKQRYQ